MIYDQDFINDHFRPVTALCPEIGGEERSSLR